MKFSDLLSTVHAYERALYSPSRTGVHLNCDCGCGGNNYSKELWNAEEDAADEAIAKAKRFCSIYMIEFDGDE